MCKIHNINIDHIHRLMTITDHSQSKCYAALAYTFSYINVWIMLQK